MRYDRTINTTKSSSRFAFISAGSLIRSPSRTQPQVCRSLARNVTAFSTIFLPHRDVVQFAILFVWWSCTGERSQIQKSFINAHTEGSINRAATISIRCSNSETAIVCILSAGNASILRDERRQCARTQIEIVCDCGGYL